MKMLVTSPREEEEGKTTGAGKHSTVQYSTVQYSTVQVNIQWKLDSENHISCDMYLQE